jgi:cell division protein FtsB
MSKAEEYLTLMMRYDKIDHQISQLKATNGGINISEEILNTINTLKVKQQEIVNEAARLQEGC